MTEGIYWMNESTHGIDKIKARIQEDQTARLENAFIVVTKAENSEKKIRAAIKAGSIPKKKGRGAWDDALAKKIISEEEFRLLSEADQVRFDAILVDDFTESEYQNKIL